MSDRYAPSPNIGFVRWKVLFGLCLIAALAYIHRVCFGVSEKSIREDLNLSPEQIGQAMGVFFLAYAICQIPAGMLVDRWGGRASLFWFAFLASASLALLAVMPLLPVVLLFPVVMFSRGMMGVCQAGLFPAATRAMCTWFPVRRRGIATGIFSAAMSVGGAIGAILTGAMLGFLNWPMIFLLLSIPGFLWAVFFCLWFRDSPKDHPSVGAAELRMLTEEIPDLGKKGRTPWGTLIVSPQLWLACGQQFFRASGNVFLLTWCATWLQEVHGLAKEDAGHLTSLPLLGVVLGSLAGGFITDALLKRTGNRNLARSGTAIGASIPGVGFILAAYFLPEAGQSILAVSLLVLGTFFCAMPNPCAYSLTMDIGGRNTAAVFGAMNMSGNIGAAFFPLVVPLVVGNYGWPAVLVLVAGVYTVGGLLWLGINAKRVIGEE